MINLPAKLPHWIQDCLAGGYEPEVCRSNAGFYIGAMEDGVPYARYSDYYTQRDAAEKALNEGTWTPRPNP